MRAPQQDRGPFILLVCLVLGYVIARAVLVPITNDECTSFLAYAQPGTFLPFASMWDANNHYLSTALGMLGYRIMGFSWFALRWASVLAFVAYALGAWRMGAWVIDRFVRWSLWCALLMCPLLLDFFALYRGYGVALAGLLLAFEALVRYTMHGGPAAWRTALFASLVAGLALIGVVPVWGLLLMLLAFAAFKRWPQLSGAQKWQHALWWIIVGAVPFTVMLALAVLQFRLGLLYHGNTTGLVSVTIGSLSMAVLGTDGSISRFVILLLLTGAVLMAFLQYSRAGWRSPLVLVAGVLAAEVVARFCAAHMIGLNYPEDRAALHLLLLFILLIALALDELATHDRRWLLLALPLWYLPGRTLVTANMDHTVLWPEQSIPVRFVERVRDLERTLDRPVVVGTHRLAGSPWSLQARRCGVESDASALCFPHGADDIRLVDKRFLTEASIGYTVVDSAPSNGLYLLRREEPLLTTLAAHTGFSFDGGGAELIEACSVDARALRVAQGLVDVRGTLSALLPLAEARVAVAVTDSLGAVLHNDLVFLGTRRERWGGEEWRIVRPLPKLPKAQRLHFYFWDPFVRQCTMRQGQLTFFSLRNDTGSLER
ncbi:MAG: hypothetical protein ABI432_13105 [Flavobacteriales bacterium]